MSPYRQVLCWLVYPPLTATHCVSPVRLQMLDASYNGIVSIPKEIEALTALKDVNLSHNQLDGYPGQFYKLRMSSYLVVPHFCLDVVSFPYLCHVVMIDQYREFGTAGFIL